MKILVTGGNGFIGKSLLEVLQSEKYQLVSSIRNNKESNTGKIKFY